MMISDRLSRMTDAELLQEFKDLKSEEAFKVLVDRHYQMVYRVCLNLLYDEALSCDATQATFIILVRNIMGIKEPNHLSGWLIGVAKQVVLNLRRARVRRDRRERDAAAMIYAENNENRLAWEQVCGNLDEAIASLAPNLQEPVLRHFLGGKSRREVATELGASEKAIEHRIARAVAQLRKFFGAKGTAVSSAALLSALSIQSAQAAPSGLAETCHAMAMQNMAGTLTGSASASIANDTLKMMFWAKFKMVAAILAVAGLLGTGGGVAALNFHVSTPGPEEPPKIIQQAQPAALAVAAAPLVNPDVTAAVETLGKPFPKGPYASNVWDMQLFKNRIYLGHGNSNNYGPEPNAGPVPIIYLDLASKQFVNEDRFIAREEQIAVYRIIGGKLYAPGSDAQENWSRGNFYTLEVDGWQKHRTIPQGINIFDLHEFGDKIFVVANCSSPASSVMSSTDEGKTWKTYPELGIRPYQSIFTLNGVLYSLGMLYNMTSIAGSCAVVEYDGLGFRVRNDLNFKALFPGIARKNASISVQHPINFANQVVYIGGWIRAASPQNNEGLFIASSLQKGNVQVKRANLPEGAIPVDTLVRDDKLNVLLNRKTCENPETFNISVLSTMDCENWTELFHFSSSSFARSFEECNGDFYFGLGTDMGKTVRYTSYTNTLKAESGTILKVPKAAYAPGPLALDK